MIKDIAKYRFLYENSFKILRSLFRNLVKEDFEDFFQTAYMKKFEVFQDTYKPDAGTELSYLIQILKNEILSQMRSDRVRNENFKNFDFQNLIDEKRANHEIVKAIESFGIPAKLTPAYIQDYLFSDKMERGLITARKIKEHSNEEILFKNNLHCLKRKVWTSKKIITEENYKEIVRGEIKGTLAPLHYRFTDPLPVIKIKCWISCSKIE